MHLQTEKRGENIFCWEIYKHCLIDVIWPAEFKNICEISISYNANIQKAISSKVHPQNEVTNKEVGAVMENLKQPVFQTRNVA